MLFRSLDYYRRTTFEFSSGALDSAQTAVGGGGRYDGLVEDLGGAPTPGIGFAIGAMMSAVRAVDVDVGWLLTLGERMLDGQRPYIDFFEANPPMSILLYLPAVALGLAFTFGSYGLVKKSVSLPAVEGLTVETAVLVVPAAALLLAAQATEST